MNNDFRKLLNFLEVEYNKDKFKYFTYEDLIKESGVEKNSLLGILGNTLGYIEYNFNNKGYKFKA